MIGSILIHEAAESKGETAVSKSKCSDNVKNSFF